MHYIIEHESARRLRICIPWPRMSLREADLLEYYLKSRPFVTEAKVNERTGGAVIRFAAGIDAKGLLAEAMAEFSYEDEEIAALVPEETGRALNREFTEKIVFTVTGRIFRKLFWPMPLRTIRTIWRSIRYIRMAVKSLKQGKLEVSVLDAAAIVVSMLLGDFTTASSVMFWLRIGELLEEWTHRKSVQDLASAMSLKVDRVWLKTDAEDVLVDVKTVQKGDRIVVGTSNIIPLDGKVVDGAAMVNQSSMTGESIPVEKKEGGFVYAGTVVEEGSCVIEVTKPVGSGRYDRIVKMIEESEKLKSETETRAFHLADKLVPYSLAGTAVTWLLTRNVQRAISFLMVDFSCALKLSMPLAVLSALREAGQHDISVKGGKFLEAVAQADTIVFDKTGTLTRATPQVVDIVTFNDLPEEECLRIAACLEEHYPHSVANAIVEEARRRGIFHAEMHAQVQYVVAHGVSSEVDGKKAIIGSYHFVFEDEGTVIPEGQEEKLGSLPEEYSHLFLAIDGKLVAAVCIFDPLREEAGEVIDALHESGIGRVCMMTGDNERTAAAIVRKLNIDEYHAGVLPEDKAEFIRKEHEAGRTVIMVGDGINDTPALSEADCGIAISDGAAIAREIADVTITSDSLYQLLYLRELSLALMKRINTNYRFIIAFNAGLIGLGVAGVLAPSTSSLLHNASTVVAGVRSMTDLLPEKEDESAAMTKAPAAKPAV